MDCKIFCVTFSGPSVTDDMRDLLFATAYLMMRSHEKKKRFRGDACEGYIRTSFKEVVLDSLSGIQFSAFLETSTGQLTVSYIVRHRDLEEMEKLDEGAWLGPEDYGQPFPEHKIRPNPIKRAAKRHMEN